MGGNPPRDRPVDRLHLLWSVLSLSMWWHHVRSVKIQAALMERLFDALFYAA